MEAFKIVAERVKAELKRRGMTQEDLAELVGVSRANLTQTLARNFQIENLFLWAKELGISPAALVAEESPADRARNVDAERIEALKLLLAADADTLTHVLRVLRRPLARSPGEGKSGAG